MRPGDKVLRSLARMSVEFKRYSKLQGERFIPDLEVTHLDDSGRRYLVEVTTVEITAGTYRVDASRKPGVAAAKAGEEKPESISPRSMAKSPHSFQRQSR